MHNVATHVCIVINGKVTYDEIFILFTWKIESTQEYQLKSLLLPCCMCFIKL